MQPGHGRRAARGPSARARPRIFIDFSMIGYRTRVTGIPRVAYAYLEEGYSLMSEQGFELLPVYVRGGALTDARPFLVGSNLRHFRRHPGLGSLYQLLRSWLYFVLQVLRLGAISCLVPFLRLASLLLSFEFFDLWQGVLQRAFRAVFFQSKRLINDSLGGRVDFQPGDILFMPAYWHDTPPGFYLRLRQRGLVLCPLVHDVLPITHPEHYESPWREQFKRWVFEVLSNSDHIYYVSEATRREVALLNAREFHRELAAGTVLLHGSDLSAGRQGPAQPPPQVRAILEGEPYFLMVGSIEPKKNHLKVVAEFERLWSQRARANLVIVGRPGWKDEAIRQALASNPFLHASLLWLEGLDDGALELLYRRATAVIQASEAEGFGLPIIEALALGTPVLANDIPVFREVAGGHAVFFDIHREGDLGEKVEQQLHGAPRPVVGFSWPTWSERARALYGDLLARSRAAAPEPERGRAAPEIASA